MAKVDKTQQAEGQNPDHVQDPSVWDSVQGEEYGGESELLQLDIGSVTKQIRYIGKRRVDLGLGETDTHDGQFVDSGKPVRLPVSHQFKQAVDQANLRHGDVFMARRSPDITPKRGPQAGKAIPNFEVKVISRAKRDEDRD